MRKKVMSRVQSLRKTPIISTSKWRLLFALKYQFLYLYSFLFFAKEELLHSSLIWHFHWWSFVLFKIISQNIFFMCISFSYFVTFPHFFPNLILESSRSSPKNSLSKSSYSQIIPLVPCLFFPPLLWPFSSKISSYFYFSFFWNIVNVLLFWNFLGLIDFLGRWNVLLEYLHCK